MPAKPRSTEVTYAESEFSISWKGGPDELIASGVISREELDRVLAWKRGDNGTFQRPPARLNNGCEATLYRDGKYLISLWADKTQAPSRRTDAVTEHGRVEVSEGWDDVSYSGTRDALIAAMHVSPGSPFPGDRGTEGKHGVRFIDEDGRRRVISKRRTPPGAPAMFCVRVYFSKEEAKERFAKTCAQMESHEKRRALRASLESTLRRFPANEAGFAERCQASLSVYLDFIDDLARGRFAIPGCTIDSDSLAGVQEKLSEIREIFEMAEYCYDTEGIAKLKRAIRQMDAQEDTQLQGFLNTVGAR